MNHFSRNAPKPQPASAAFLLKTAGADGEMHVIRLDASGPLQEHEGFEAYLRDRRDWFAEYVAQEKADRQGLKNDE